MRMGFEGPNEIVPTAPVGDSSNRAASTAFTAAAIGSLKGYLFGLTLSASGSTATFGISAGLAADSTGAAIMTLASAYTKTTGAWVVGTGNGALDTGAVANTTYYHVFLIERTDTGVVDVLFSLSATAPTTPPNYTLFRRIGSMKTDGSAQWVKFIQDGDFFQWSSTVLDVSATNPGTSAVTVLLSVPTGINVQAYVQSMTNATSANGIVYSKLSDLATADETPASNNTDTSLADATTGGVNLGAARVYVRTNTSSQVRDRISFSDATVGRFIRTIGWIDTRGRNS